MLQPSIEVIILHHNGRENIDNCLKSVIKTDYSNFTITVVDNNSTDDSAEFLKKNFQSIKLIENKVNLGYAGGNNIALKQTKAKYAILLNDDTIVMPKWLKEMLNAMESDTKIATCQPKVLSLRNKSKFDKRASLKKKAIQRDVDREVRGRRFDFEADFW